MTFIDMNISEAAKLLNFRREEIKTAITDGILLPISKERIVLTATSLDRGYDIKEDDLDRFINAFEKEEPGRHPPVSVRRELAVEANHRCAICKEPTPLQYHHIVEFSKIKHHDPAHMLAICGTCHSKINLGDIDVKGQKMYKEKLKEYSLATQLGIPHEDLFADGDKPIRLLWHEVREVVGALHENIKSHPVGSESKYDFAVIDLKKKNKLNNLAQAYFRMMKDHHESSFWVINEFLSDPINRDVTEQYYEIVDDIRSVIAAERNNFGGFEEVLIWIRQSASTIRGLNNKKRSLNILLSFMYFSCDIGEKT